MLKALENIKLGIEFKSSKSEDTVRKVAAMFVDDADVDTNAMQLVT